MRAQRAAAPPLLARVLLALGGLLVGFALGIAAVAVHSRWWGLLLAAAALTSTAVALEARWWGRLSFALGVAAAIGYLTRPRPEGDYVVASDVPGYLLLGLAVALAVGATVTLRPIRRGPQPGPETAP